MGRTYNGIEKQVISNGLVSFFRFIMVFIRVLINVLKIRSIIEPEKLSVHGSLVQPVVGPRSNR